MTILDAKLTALMAVITALVACEVIAQPGPQEPAWITAHTDRNPTVSPDGTRIIFQSDRSGRLTGGDWHHRQAVPDRQGNKIYMFTFKRMNGTEVGFIGAIDVPTE